MRRLDLSDGGVLFGLTDAVPAPAAWDYSFPAARLGEHPQVVNTWLPDGKFRTRFTVFAFEQAGKIIIVDAGLGVGPSAYFNGMSGRLPDEMVVAGLDIAAVAHIFFTHFHLDHVGWATNRNGHAFFPNARYHAPQAELAHWRNCGAQAALPHHVGAYERHIAPLIASNRLEAENPGEIIARIGAREISYRSVPGHTAGHCAVVIAGGDETLLIAGDTWHSPAQIAVPDWCHRADRDPIEARRSRMALGEWARDCQAIVAAGHFPEEIAFGRVEGADAEHLAFVPIAAAKS
jgi:glyoxylase-like metal-dependent hydrolase (beta-lactamase superfamily II)